ncbi:DUF2934 domain-containing protein [Rubellimicrobium roseum]
MIRQRAHAVWEQEGRPHGRHEEHWQMAAAEITQELDRIKAAHAPATAEEVEAPAAPRKRRPHRAEGGEPATAPRMCRISKTTFGESVALGDEPAASDEVHRNAPHRRGRKAANEVQAEAGSVAAKTTRPRATKGTEGAQSEPAADAAPRSRRNKGEAAHASSDTSATERPAKRGRKPRPETETIH